MKQLYPDINATGSMKIIIVSNYYFPEIGAAPNRITSLAEGLSDNNHQVEVICPLPNYPKGKIFHEYRHRIRSIEKVGTINTYRYWIYPSISKNAVKRVLSMCSFALTLWIHPLNRSRIRKPDWVIIQSPPLLVAFSAIILFKLVLRRRVALNVSDIWPLSAFEMGVLKKGRFYRFLEFLEKYNYKHSDLIMGQSEEILAHVSERVSKKRFLYRNIQNIDILPDKSANKTSTSFRIVYAGLLGVAQGIYNILTEVNFAELGLSLDIFGHGNEKERIEKYINDHPERAINYCGSVSREKVNSILIQYDASLVPLAQSIKGAVPSKIFELAQLGIPVIFCGGGEGASIVERFKLGITSPPGDYALLRQALASISNLSENEYSKLRTNCLSVSQKHFNFESQIRNLITMLSDEE